MLQISPKIWNISRVALMLILVSAGVILFSGVGVISASGEIKVLQTYLDNAQEVQPNFEKNIELYTTKTEKVFASLMKLRPSGDDGYVSFISSVENIGKQLSLNIDTKSYEDSKSKDSGDAPRTISYVISFYGTDGDLRNFISALQDLPYFVRIFEVSFRNLDNLSADERKEKNISLKIQLYIK